MARYVYIYTANHLLIEGIEDNVKSLVQIFESTGIRVVVTNVLPPEDALLCIIIENFTDRPLKSIKRFYSFLEAHKIPKVLLHTEFLASNGKINTFTYRGTIIRNIFGLFPTFFYQYRNKFWFKLYISLTFCIYPIALILGISYRDFVKILYWEARSKKLMDFIGMHDYHICLSEDVHNCVEHSNMGISAVLLRPAVDIENIFCNIENFSTFCPSIVVATGSMTSHRKQMLNALRSLFGKPPKYINYILSKTELIGSMGSKNLTELVKDFGCESSSELIPYRGSLFVLTPSNKDLNILKALARLYPRMLSLFELYIGQTSKWPYHSPMRIFRSLNQGFIPISIGRYNPAIISDLILEFDSIDDLCSSFHSKSASYISSAKKMILHYNAEALQDNLDVIQQLMTEVGAS